MTDSFNDTDSTIVDAKQGIQTFAIFYYQSLIDAGYSIAQAKAGTAELLEEEYNSFVEKAGIQGNSLGTVEKRIDRMVKKAMELAADTAAIRPLYNDLLSLRAHLGRK